MKGLWIKTGFLLVVFSGVAFGQITMDFLGGGARAQGMGKAFYAVSDDITAVTWNPAGLAKQEKSVLGVTYGLFDPRGSFSGGTPTKINQNASFKQVSFLGFMSPLRIRGHQFVLSAAYNRAFNEYTSENYADSAILPETYQGVIYATTPAAFATNVDYHGAPYTVTFGFGTRLYHSWDMGMALNIFTGKGVTHIGNAVTAAEFLPIDLLGQTVNYDSIQRITDTVRYGGVSVTLATKYSSPRFDLGFVIKTGYSLKEKSNLISENIVSHNGLVQAGSTDTIYIDNQLDKVIVPWVFGAGVAYKIRPNWLGSLDLEYRPWSGKKIQHRTQVVIKSGGDNVEVFQDTLPGWYNAFVVRAGTEYLWKTNNRVAPTVPLRAGLGYVPVPGPSLVDLTLNPNVSDSTHPYLISTESMTMYTLSLGTGVYWSQIHLDLAYTYSSLTRKYFGSNKLNGRNHDVAFSFTGYF